MVAMATTKINKHCHDVQNDPHKSKIKLEKFHFDIVCRFGVIKESLPWGRNPPPPPGEIGLKNNNKIHLKKIISFLLALR